MPTPAVTESALRASLFAKLDAAIQSNDPVAAQKALSDPTAAKALGQALSKTELTKLQEVHDKFGSNGDVTAAVKTVLGDTSKPGRMHENTRRNFAEFITRVSQPPVGPTPGTGTTVSAVASPDIIHSVGKGKITVTDGFSIPEAMLDQHAKGVRFEDIGSARMLLPGAAPYTVKFAQYRRTDGEVGMHLIPTADLGTKIVMPDGTKVEGYKLLEDFVRNALGLEPADPIATTLVHFHPEGHEFTSMAQFAQVEGGYLATEMGQTHTSGRRSDGVTKSAPAGYHGDTFGLSDHGTDDRPHVNSGRLFAYPGTEFFIELEGVSNRTQAYTEDFFRTVVSDTPRFDGDYKNAEVQTKDLPSLFLWFKEFVNDGPLKDHPNWRTYCEELQSNIGELAKALPLVEERWVEIYGAEGKALFAKATERFKKNNNTFTTKMLTQKLNRPATQADVTAYFEKQFADRFGRAPHAPNERDGSFMAPVELDFTPLWVREGLTAAEVRSYKNIGEHEAYEKAKAGGTLSSFTGFVPPPPGAGMITRPESTSDLVKDLLETYLPFARTNGYLQVAALLGFQNKATSRLKLTPAQTMPLFASAMGKIIAAEAQATAPIFQAKFPSDPVAKLKAHIDSSLKQALGGMIKVDLSAQPPAIAPGSRPTEAQAQELAVRGLIDSLVKGVEPHLPQMLLAPLGDPTVMREEAARSLRQGIVAEEKAGRSLVPGGPGAVEFNKPPAWRLRAAVGIHETSKHVKVRALCSAWPAEHMQVKNAQGQLVSAVA